MEHPFNLCDFCGNYSDLCNLINKLNEITVVVFFAKWCPPSKALFDLLPKLASEYQNITFLVVRVEESTDLVSHYDITSIPNIRILKPSKDNHNEELVSIIGNDIGQIREKLKQAII